MSVIVLTSASGSPGVTTTAVGLALSWPRPVLLLEADPTGGSAVLAGYLRGLVTPAGSVIDLAQALHGGDLLEALAAASMPLPGCTASLVPAVGSHTQARSLVALWEPLAAALQSLEETGQDVIVDAGRLGLFASPDPLVDAADLALLVVRTDLVSVLQARSWAHTLAERFEKAGAAANVGLLTVGTGEPFRPKEIAKVLALPVIASVAWDPASAAVYSRGARPPGGSWRDRLTRRDPWADAPLQRSLRAAHSAITGTIRATAQTLNLRPVGRAT